MEPRSASGTVVKSVPHLRPDSRLCISTNAASSSTSDPKHYWPKEISLQRENLTSKDQTCPSPRILEDRYGCEGNSRRRLSQIGDMIVPHRGRKNKWSSVCTEMSFLPVLPCPRGSDEGGQAWSSFASATPQPRCSSHHLTTLSRFQCSSRKEAAPSEPESPGLENRSLGLSQNKVFASEGNVSAPERNISL